MLYIYTLGRPYYGYIYIYIYIYIYEYVYICIYICAYIESLATRVGLMFPLGMTQRGSSKSL